MVQQQGPLSVRDAVDCILQAAEGLQYAHDKGADRPPPPPVPMRVGLRPPNRQPLSPDRCTTDGRCGAAPSRNSRWPLQRLPVLRRGRGTERPLLAIGRAAQLAGLPRRCDDFTALPKAHWSREIRLYPQLWKDFLASVIVPCKQSPLLTLDCPSHGSENPRSGATALESIVVKHIPETAGPIQRPSAAVGTSASPIASVLLASFPAVVSGMSAGVAGCSGQPS